MIKKPFSCVKLLLIYLALKCYVYSIKSIFPDICYTKNNCCNYIKNINSLILTSNQNNIVAYYFSGKKEDATYEIKGEITMRNRIIA